MKTISYLCLDCNYKFRQTVAESREEAEEVARKGQKIIQVNCPRCRSQHVVHE